MTDKEIVIDGVDVSGCLFYQSNFEEDYDIKIKHFCSNWHNSCESSNNSNCYFKQLKRKEQECDELKEELARIEEDLKYQCVDCMNIKSDRYRKGLEEIEKNIKDYCKNMCMTETKETCEGCQNTGILNIINKAKGKIQMRSKTIYKLFCAECKTEIYSTTIPIYCPHCKKHLLLIAMDKYLKCGGGEQ